jgi:hypothetical protein
MTAVQKGTLRIVPEECADEVDEDDRKGGNKKTGKDNFVCQVSIFMVRRLLFYR